MNDDADVYLSRIAEAWQYEETPEDLAQGVRDLITERDQLRDALTAALEEAETARGQVAALRKSHGALLNWLNPNTDPVPPDTRAELWATAELIQRATAAAATAHDAVIRAAERERCAQIAEQDSLKAWIGGSTGSAAQTAINIAAAIREAK